MTHEAVFEFDYESPAVASRVERAITPEIGEIDDKRSETTLDRDAHRLTITVEATDLVALRAAMNTWLSLVSVAEATGGTSSA